MQGMPLTTTSRSDSLPAGSPVSMRATPLEGRPLASGQISSGQVISSQPAAQGDGYRVQVQLTSGEQLTLRTDRPLAEGQQLQLQGRNDGQLQLRLLPPTPATVASRLLAQLPALQIQLSGTNNLQLPVGSGIRGEVSSSLTQGGRQLVSLQLSSGQTLQLPLDRPLATGQQIHLTRTEAGLELRLLTREMAQQLDQLLPAQNPGSNTASNRNTPPPASLQTLLEMAGAQLRQALPRQAPLSQPLQQLAQLVRQLPTTPGNETPRTADRPVTTTNSSTSPQTSNPVNTLREHLGGLLRLIPQGNQPPTANALQQFIPFSGLLLEANIARGAQTSPTGGDLKLLLQQASALIRQGALQGQTSTPRQQQVTQQIAQQLQAAESRIQVLQQSSLQATQATHERGQPGQILQLDLPYAIRGDWFQAQLEIRRWIDEKDAEAALEELERQTRCWEVQLSFDLQDWGKIHTLLRLKGEQLKADIWVESETAFAPISHQAELLEARLRRVGAEVERVDCHLGTPSKLKNSTNNQQIIDTRI
ncbi:MAG: flagellar hook-length control protein FliK [Marinospirillum sp.]|uniref:flagellar hook-length control protein FliK n=1 Tax=Marinospirillum sp. TaxID=2183934 RepID=UPI0019F96C39|nr:flagellar hook-length control protein FliK [Marinospirillum sp.]MBE0505285.1 flagellar hook-length control protein FliK [Marinospirillum sp.]